jgi:hypothetical protein
MLAPRTKMKENIAFVSLALKKLKKFLPTIFSYELI